MVGVGSPLARPLVSLELHNFIRRAECIHSRFGTCDVELFASGPCFCDDKAMVCCSSRKVVYTLLLCFAAWFPASAELVIHGVPDGALKNEAYQVDVREGSGEWRSLFVYDAVVGKEGSAHIGFVMFDSDFSSSIELRVRPARKSERVRVRPRSAHIQAKHQANETVIPLDQVGQYSVEFDEDIFGNLLVFANPIEADPITAEGPGITYFGPGLHLLGGDGRGTMAMESGSTVYFAGGAIVYGKIDTGGKNDLTIRGRGILCGSKFDHSADSARPTMVYIGNSKNLHLEGLVILDAPAWNIHLHHVRNATVRNVKILSWMTETDGINPRGSQDLLIENCFIRNGDDCISIKLGNAKNPSAVTQRNRNIIMQNCVLWPDRAHALLIGPEGASSEPSEHMTENVQFRDIDILRSAESSTGFWGALAIMASDRQTIRNVLFENIRVAPLDAGNLIDIRFVNNVYTKDYGDKIENIRFKNVRLEGPNNERNRILGHTAERIVNGVQFDGLWINGKKVLTLEEGGFETNAFVEEIDFR